MFCEQVWFVAPSTTALPGRLSDARKAKPLPPPKFRRSPNTIEDSSLYEIAINRDAPSKNAAGSRDPDPHPEEPPRVAAKSA